MTPDRRGIGSSATRVVNVNGRPRDALSTSEVVTRGGVSRSLALASAISVAPRATSRKGGGVVGALPRAVGVSGEAAGILALQRVIGNRAVAALFGGRAAGGTRWLARVEMAGRTTLIDTHNKKIFSDALDAILECQDALLSDPDSWVSWATEINDELIANGVTQKALTEIEAFYAQAAELSFISNPILAETWRRCVAATRQNSLYAQVGGKFARKFPVVLDEIVEDFSSLKAKCDLVRTDKVNKEHQINKGKKFGGAQVAAWNLQYAGVPPSGSKATLSEFHTMLHSLKPGTGKPNFDALHPAIELVIKKQQAMYSATAMGQFHF
jgi:hypothetical protein